jgi:TolA-binding protein
MKTTIFAVCAAAGLLTIDAARAGTADSVTYRQASGALATVTGSIAVDDKEGIRIGSQVIKPEQIENVQYDKRPEEFIRAESLYKNKNWGAAESKFRTVSYAAPGVNQFLKQYGQYYIAAALSQQGKFKDAAREYETLVKDYPNSRFYYVARYEMGRCYIQLKDYPRVEKFAQDLAALPAGRWCAAGKVLQGYIAESKNDKDNAKKLFQTAADMQGADGAIRAEAFVGAARNEADPREQARKAKVAASMDSEATPGVINEACMMVARAQKDSKDRGALLSTAWHYLKVADSDAAAPELAAEALYGAGEALSKIPEDGQAKPLKALAKTLLDRCARTRTEWAAKAEALGKTFK